MEERQSKKKYIIISLSLLFLLSNYASVCVQAVEPPQVRTAKLIASSPHPKENHPPETPQRPQGPLVGDVGAEYSFSTLTSDPDDDYVYYWFDWGDGTTGSWVGPFESGTSMNLSHVWHERGTYPLKVKAKDVYNSESNWSDSLSLMLTGPYLTLGTISGGIGLGIEIRNIGEDDAKNVTIDIRTENGLFVIAHPNQIQIKTIPAGNSTEQKIRLWGIGLGVLSDLPKITITTHAVNTKTRGKQVQVRLLGPLVKKVGESWSTDEAFNGYTLYSPMVSPQTFLINNSGATVHTWESSYKPALSVYLLQNGDLLRTAFPGSSPRFWGGGIGGRVERFDWNGTLQWYYQYSTSDHCLHHDVQILPNGNILMIAWEYKSAAEAIAKGRNPSTIPQGEMWPDHLIEVHPDNGSGGTIVWEWHLWDHLIQDFDSTKENYGVVQDHPELVDINYGGRVLADWTHTNSVDYNEQYDQILLSVLLFDEIWVIDHSTTTAEAAGHSGGKYGRGGDLLYRWGNPLAYKMGDSSDRKLFNQHDAEWITAGLPGEGDILVFNNGLERPGGDYSSIEEITPPIEPDGSYTREPGSAYGPTDSVWRYTAEPPSDFSAVNLGSAQRLPNGDTLICDGPKGRFFEVTNEQEVVWEFVNQIPDPIDHHVFKIVRYAPEYSGLRFL